MHQDDLERRLDNWARWYWSGGRLGQRSGGVVSGIYHHGGHGSRGGVAMPVIDGEAIDTNAAVDRLPQDPRNVLRARYLHIGPRGRWLGGLNERQIAGALGLSKTTYYERLITARQLLVDQLAARKRALPRASLTPVGTA